MWGLSPGAWLEDKAGVLLHWGWYAITPRLAEQADNGDVVACRPSRSACFSIIPEVYCEIVATHE
ncbi:hypothetical protein [Paludibacterium denitrificans]|uniref:Uncharacterized protein n=1 Tax=Paludibacterium denitrificans TaxID=2675226 RepID=A0A844GAM2_9NEIS|nr:hypothetical protein [Paludibacterium denitrificans]MTD33453.1 hypothetical protein [Paludibacterium denitrificans]